MTFAYSPEKEMLLKPLIASFNSSGAEVEGKRVFVVGENVSSGDAQLKISRGTYKPVAWSPSSSMWGRLLNFEADQPYVADENPSIVRTPLVIAMWEPMAQALGYPKRKLGFADILKLARSKEGWGAFGKPEFGQFKLVHTNPDFSTSGLSAVVAEYYAATGKKEGLVAADIERARPQVRDIERSIVHYGDTTLFIADQMRKNGPGYASAVAMEEATLVDFNQRRNGQPKLVAIYPRRGRSSPTTRTSRSRRRGSPPQQTAGAASFGKYLADNVDGSKAARYGFRAADLKAEPQAPLNAANGVDPKQPERVLGLPEPRILAALKKAWRSDRKPANVLLVLDTSGSMAQEQRLRNAKAGLQAFLKEVAPQDNIGLTTFSDRIQPLAPIAPARENRPRLRSIVSNLIADGGTAIYDATTEGVAQVVQAGGHEPHQRRRAADRRRGHGLHAQRRSGRHRARGAGRLEQARARLHDRLLGRRGGRRGEPAADRRRLGRQGVRRQDVGHRVRVPEHQLVLLDGSRWGSRRSRTAARSTRAP